MGLRIIIVEDETLIAMELQAILEDEGHDVAGIAADTAGALRLAGRHAVDVAVMDVDLAGGSDGVETARRLREEHAVASLFVSAKLDEEARARALAWEPLGFIGKPFEPRQIIAALGPATSRLSSAGGAR